MQSNHFDIYRMVSEQTGKPEQMYKDIGSFIFKETSQMLKDPTSLILKLKGIGSWHLRKKRMEILVTEWTDRAKLRARDEFSNDLAYYEHMQKYIQYKVFEKRLKDYEEYLSIKKEIRAKRDECQRLLEPDKGEDGRYKSGKD